MLITENTYLELAQRCADAWGVSADEITGNAADGEASCESKKLRVRWYEECLYNDPNSTENNLYDTDVWVAFVEGLGLTPHKTMGAAVDEAASFRMWLDGFGSKQVMDKSFVRSQYVAMLAEINVDLG